VAAINAPRPDAPRNPGGSTPEEFDRDVDIRGVVWTGVGLAAITAAAFVLMWFFVRGLMASGEARDPEPLPMPEAAEPALPPGPRLQATPEEELREMLGREKELLETYGVIDGEGGYARIPIERAMELTLERGVGAPSEAPAAEGTGQAPEAGAPEASDAP